jgi:penicillin amidase
MQRLRLALVLALLPACHPASCFYPPELPKDTPLELVSTDGTHPAEKVEVIVDDKGIPHIYGESENDLAYGLGFMHGKDRQWQVLSTKLGIYGRLTEILGEGSLAQDRQARMIVYRLDEQYAATSARDKAMFESYAAGVNAGAAFAGPSIEMQVLGVEWEPYEPKDVLTIVRYFAWDLSAGMDEELARNRLMRRIDVDDPRYPFFMGTVSTMGVPVVSSQEHSGQLGFDRSMALDEDGVDIHGGARGGTAVLSPSSSTRPFTKPVLKSKGKRLDISERTKAIFSLGDGGASNVWAVSGANTASGNAVLAHDPHLRHSGPGLFYLVHMEGPDFTIAGGSAPGAPGVLLGHGKHVAWGTPVSNVDSQDLVRIAPYLDRPDLYLLDGEPRAYEILKQTYKLGSGADAEVFEEEWKITAFGPVLPEPWDAEMDEGDVFAFMWPGHDPIEGSGSIVTSLWDLAKSTNVEEATAAIQRLTQPPITMGMAFDDGTIAYRLAGDIPVRKSDEPVTLPRDGRYSTAGWLGRLPPEFKPQLTNPPRGFLVAANQRIVEGTGPQARIIGSEGTAPYRAERITERLRALIDSEEKPTTDDIVGVQQDIVSTYAREVAPILGRFCPVAIDGVDENALRSLCRALVQFDGAFTNDSKGALVFMWMDREVRRQVMLAHLDEDTAEQVKDRDFIVTNLHVAMRMEARGDMPAIYDIPSTAEREGLRHFITKAAPIVLEKLTAALGGPENWRYGALHRLSFSWSLAAIPVVGNMLFKTPAVEEPGCSTCPRAESGRQSTNEAITNGAVLRIAAEMSDPPVIRIINDTGASGHYGHRHAMDANPLWSSGDPLVLARDKDDVEATVEGRVNLLPKE